MSALRLRLGAMSPTLIPRLVAAVGLTLTAIITLHSLGHARDLAHREERGNLRTAVDTTRQATRTVLRGLDDLATLYADADRRPVPDEQLYYAAGKLLLDPLVMVASLLRTVPDAERPAFERAHGPIVEPDGRKRAPRRRSYTVIVSARSSGALAQTSPQFRQGPFIDVGSAPDRMRSLAVADATRSASATVPTGTVLGNMPAIAVYQPVRLLDGRRSRLKVAVLFDARRFERTIRDTLPAGIGVQLSDSGISFDGRRVPAARDRRRTATVTVAGRPWTITVDPIAAERDDPAAVAGLGLTITLLLVVGAVAITRREQAARMLAVLGARERDAAALARDTAAREAALAEARARFLEANATDILLLTAPDGTLTYVSPAALEGLGIPPEQLVGRTLADLSHPDDASRVRALVANLHRVDGPVDLTHRLQHADGHWVWVETLLRPVRDEETHAVVEAQGSVRDVTRRRDAERRLREAENRFRSAFEEAPLGMAVVGLGGGLLQINRALVALTGWEEGVASLSAFDALLHMADAEEHRHARDALLEGDLREHSAELRLVRPDGAVLHAAVHTALVSDGEGRPRHYLVQVQDISERRRAEAQLQYLVDRDALTGLLNRRAFERSLDEHLRRGRRYGVQGAVLVVDLDDFGALAARLGPSAGERVLTRVAAALRARVRQSDLLCRYGDDAFAVLLPFGGLGEALEVGSALADAVRDVAVEGVPEGLTASVGLALVDRPELRGDELLSDADLAMYDAKQAGRDRLRQAAGRPDRSRPIARPAADPAAAVRAALEEDRLELLAEPVLDVSTHEVQDLALRLRLRTPDGDLQTPGSFLADAVRAGLMPSIDAWMVVRAAELLAANPDGPSLTVGVSVRSIVGDTLVDTLGHALTEQRVDPRRLTVALPEHEAVAQLARVQEFGRDLAHLGCPLALEAVGGGFGSFLFLKHLPFRALHIDGGFVRHCATEHVDQVLLASLVELAQGVGARTVACDVPDLATLHALEALGVDAAQGPAAGGALPVLEAFEAARRSRPA